MSQYLRHVWYRYPKKILHNIFFMKQLLVNVIWLPATCDQYGMNLIIATMLALALGWYELNKINKHDKRRNLQDVP